MHDDFIFVRQCLQRDNEVGMYLMVLERMNHVETDTVFQRKPN